MRRIPNNFEQIGDHAEIVIVTRERRTFRFKVDIVDLERVRMFKWSVTQERYAHAWRRGEGGWVRLHRLLLDPVADGLEVDHINHDTFDNRRSNLRVVTKAANQQNRAGANSNSKIGIRGVMFDARGTGCYRAEAMRGGKRVRLGPFATAIDARRALTSELAT